MANARCTLLWTVVGLLLLSFLTFAPGVRAANPIFELSMVGLPYTAVTSVTVDENTGYFYLLGPQYIQVITDIYTPVINQIPLVDPYVDKTAGSGTIVVHKNPITAESFLFVCQGSAIGIFNLNSTFSSVTQLSNVTSGADLITSCSLEIEGVLWFGTAAPNLGYLTASDPSDYTQPWLLTSTRYGVSSQGVLYTTAGGAGFYTTNSGARNLMTFTAYPFPSVSAVPKIGSISIFNSAKCFGLDPSNSLLCVNGISVSQYPNSGSNIIIEAVILSELVTQATFSSLAADDRVGKRVFWASNCRTGTTAISRFYLDSTTSQSVATHESYYYSQPCNANPLQAQTQGPAGTVDRNHAIVMTFPAGGYALFTKMYSCETSTTCGECALDSMYCSWCVGPEGGSCVVKDSCAAGNVSLTTCPVLTSTTPPSISSSGATALIVTGAGFSTLKNETAALGGLYCLVGNSSLSPATVVSSTLLTCNLQPIDASGSLELTLALNTSQPLDTGTSLSLSVYNCSAATTCASCAISSQPDCVWCASDGICQSRLNHDGICPTVSSPLISFGSTSLHCASLTSISPSSIPVHFSTNASLPQTVTLMAPFANLTGTWQCSFVFPTATISTSAVLTYQTPTDSIVTCPIAPFSGTFGTGVTSVTVPVEVLLNGKLYTPNAMNLVYYNCSSFSSCSSCTSNKYCGWSLSGTQCGPQVSGTTPFCPTAGLAPLSTMGTTTTPLTITGGPFVSSTSYSCAFGTPISSTVSATFASSSSLTCSAPTASVSDPFDVSVTVLLNSSPYVTAGLLRYYTCFPSTLTCTNCADPLHVGCSWCRTETSCNTTAALTSTCSSLVTGQCPNITSVSPAIGAITGNLDVTLSGGLLDASGTYSCLFLGPEAASSSPMAFYQATLSAPTASSASCSTPDVSSAGAGPYSVTLQYNDTNSVASNLSSVASFDFVDCHAMATCSGCLSTSQCQWCLFDATCHFSASDGCEYGSSFAVTTQATCPVISSVVPSAASTNVITAVTVTGQHLTRTGVNGLLRCILDDAHILPAIFVSSDGTNDVYQCNTSIASATGVSTFQFDLSLGAPVSYAPWNDVNGNPNNFTFYDCSSATTCDQCANLESPYCGWCSSDHKCSSIGVCSNENTWAQPGCPRVTGLSLMAADAVSVGKPFVVSVQDLDLSSNMTLACLFSTLSSSVSTPVTAVDLVTGQVTCDVGVSPNNVTFSANASVSIVNALTLLPFTTNFGDSFFDPSSTLEYVQCTDGSSQGSCSQCLSTPGLDSRCGWCVYSGGCGVSTSCYVGSPIAAWQNSASQCPTVASIDPTSGPATGNTQITITGTNFIEDSTDPNGPALFCAFDDSMVSAVYVTTAQLYCTTPAVDVAAGAVKALSFSLLMREPTVGAGTGSAKRDALVSFSSGNATYVPFASTPSISFTFNYVSPPSSTNLGWVAAPVIIAVLVIVVLIVILVFLRRRQVARRLTPPDFNIYAFSANTRLIREVAPERREKLLELVPLLSESQYKFGLAMRSVTSGSDDELLCRALIYAAYPNSFALDMLIHFIEAEVQHCEQVGELFRSSSIACKMYTIYSKIVGIQYLWRILARSIHTLDDAGQAEDKRRTTGDASSTPPSTGQVSMMDLGSLEVDPERLAERLEKEVDEAVMADVSIYQYELLLKTSRIFKKVIDSVSSVPRELRVVAKRVKAFVTTKFPQDEMDYKGVNAFFFLRFICPAVMTPQIYGVLEHPPGETSQRYFVLISKTLQNLANGTLPSSKESYMAKMDEFVTENKETLHLFIDRLCAVQDHGSSDGGVALDDASEHNAREPRLFVSDEIYYSSLSFLHTHYMEHRKDLLQIFRSQHDDEFADRLDAVMKSISGSANGEEEAEPSAPKKPKKKKAPKSKE